MSKQYETVDVPAGFFDEQPAKSGAIQSGQESLDFDSLPDWGATPHADVKTEATKPNDIGRLQTAASKFVGGIGQTVAAIPKDIDIMGANSYTPDVQRFLDENDIERPDPRERILYRAGEALDDYMSGIIDKNPEYADDFFTSKVPNAFGQMFGFILTGGPVRGAAQKSAAKSMVKPGKGFELATGFASAAPAGMAVSSVSGLEDALKEGASLEDAFKAADLNRMLGVTEGIPIANILSRADKATGGSIKKAIKEILASGTEEAAQEAFTQVMSNLIASDVVKYDPDRKMWVGAGEGAEVGFTTGALMQTLLSLVGGGRRMVSRNNDDIGSVAPIEEDTAPISADTVFDASDSQQEAQPVQEEYQPGEEGKIDIDADTTPATSQAIPTEADSVTIAPEQAEFTPTHEMPNGELVMATDEDGVFVDQNGDEWEEPNATPIQDSAVDAGPANRTGIDVPEQLPESGTELAGGDNPVSGNAALDARTQGALRSAIDELPADERDQVIADLRAENEDVKKRLYTSPVTGTPNRVAYDDAPKKAFTASIDVDSLKWINDNMGHPAGDELLKAVGEALNEAGVEVYHVSGDEFVAQHDNDAELQQQLEQASQLLGNIDIEVELPGGEIIKSTQAGFSYGIGSEISEAEAGLRNHKSERELNGLRAERGREPTGVVRTPASGQQGQEHEAQQGIPTELDQQAPAPKAGLAGAKDRIYTPDNREIEVQYEIIDSADLVASNDEHGNINPDFPQVLQPRDRTGKKSQAQINKMASDINPERLAVTNSVTDGAPIIGEGNVVESGNGRVSAIRKAYKGNNEKYRQWLIDNADSFGLSADDVKGIKHPVLVRRRMTPMDERERMMFAIDANKPTVAGMSALETAKTDAALINDDLMASYMPSEDGNVLASSNSQFLRLFSQAIGSNDSSGLMSGDGRWTKQMADRVQAAVFHKAYGNDKLTDLLAQEADPVIKNIINALNVAAPHFARVKADAQAIGLDLPAVISDATAIVIQAKTSGISVADLVKQAGLFGDLDPTASKMAEFMDAYSRSAKRMSQLFVSAAKGVEQEIKQQGTGDMFERQSTGINDILSRAAESVEASNERQQQTADLFAQAEDAGPEPDNAKRGDGSEQAGSERAENEVGSDTGNEGQQEGIAQNYANTLRSKARNFNGKYDGRPLAPASAISQVPDSAFNGDMEDGLNRLFLSDSFTGDSVELANQGFTHDETVALERAGLATNGSMSRQQFAQWNDERGRRLSRSFKPPTGKKSKTSQPASGRGLRDIRADINGTEDPDRLNALSKEVFARLQNTKEGTPGSRSLEALNEQVNEKFAAALRKQRESSGKAFTPTHELANGTPVVATDEDNVWVDENGDEWQEEGVQPIAGQSNSRQESNPARDKALKGNNAESSGFDQENWQEIERIQNEAMEIGTLENKVYRLRDEIRGLEDGSIPVKGNREVRREKVREAEIKLTLAQDELDARQEKEDAAQQSAQAAAAINDRITSDDNLSEAAAKSKAIVGKNVGEKVVFTKQIGNAHEGVEYTVVEYDDRDGDLVVADAVGKFIYVPQYLIERVAERGPFVEGQEASVEPVNSAEYGKAKADLDDALGDLGEIFLSANLFAKKAKPTELNAADLMPVLTRVMDAAFRMGYAKFKQNARFVLDTVRDRFGDAAADSLGIDELQGAYIAMKKGTDSKLAVISVESIDEIMAEDIAETSQSAIPADNIEPQGHSEESENDIGRNETGGDSALDDLSPEVSEGLETGGLPERSPGRSTADTSGNGQPETDRSGRKDSVDGSENAVLHSAAAETGQLANSPSGRKSDRPNKLQGENPGNFTITDELALGEGTAKQKIDANLSAIRTLKQIESENRFATPDEQATLARYVGWGGLKSVFDIKKQGASDMYGRAQAELKELLTDAEYSAAFSSVRNAHYTAKGVVDAMWRAARHFGFSGGRVLEPTVGTGNFIGLQPADMAAASEWHAAELDSLTGRIAKHIYPESNVLDGTGFQDAPFADGVFDLVIGNPPFGGETIRDKSKQRKHLSGMKVHNYIIAKSGMHLRPGGVMAMVVTHRFLDTANPEAREALAKDFRFMGAIRLPNDAFLKNANTEVVTDIIFLQKLHADEKRDLNAAWLDIDGSIDIDGEAIRVNKYFEDNPGHILGRSAMDGSMYAGRRGENGGGEYTVHSDGRDISSAIDEIIKTDWASMAGTLKPSAGDTQAAEVMLEQRSIPVGGMVLNAEGKILRRDLDDDYGNAIIEEITPDSLWKDKAALWEGIHGRLVEIKDANNGDFSRNFTADDLESLVEDAKFAYLSSGNKKSSPTKAEQAVYDIVDAATNGERVQNIGELVDLVGKSLDNKRLGLNDYNRLRALLDLRNRTLALIHAEYQNDKGMEKLRESLNQAYDKFIKIYGFISDKKNLGILSGDIGTETGLEKNYQPAIKGAEAKAAGVKPSMAKAEKADILSQRVNFPYKEVTSAANAHDALHVSLSERGKVDLVYMAGLLKDTTESVIRQLSTGDNPEIFFDPEKETYEHADAYLSGNVRHKLQVAQEEGIEANIKALEAVQPAPMTKEQIRPSIRSQWIPEKIFTQFLRDLGMKSGRVSIIESIGRISVVNYRGELSDLGLQFKDPDKDISEIFDAAASGRTLNVYRKTIDGKSYKDDVASKRVNALVSRLGKVFSEWVYSEDSRSQEVVDAFNEKMNTHRKQEWNGVKYLRTVGASPSISLRVTQKNAAWRMIQSSATLLDHVVGAGKTFTVVTGVMERRRLGLSKKPMIAVPNHLVVQWASEFYQLYPGAKLLAATPDDFARKNRRRLFARIATGDYDAIIVGHSSLGFIPAPNADSEMVMQEEIIQLQTAMDEARENGDSKRTLSQMQQRIDNLQDKIKELQEKNTDDLGVDFASMGIDYLAVDEAHEFKNLAYSTAGERVVGMNDPNGSKRAFHLYTLVRGMQERDGGIAFATGTPVSNSLVELYTVMKYLATNELKLRNQQHFDAWSGAFTETETRLEYTATQKLKPRRVLSSLNNLEALRQLYEQFADIITMGDLKRIYSDEVAERNQREGRNDRTEFPVPKVKGSGRVLDIGDITPAQKMYMDYLVARMQVIESKGGDKEYPRIDNPLNVLTDARKMSLDIRTVDPSAQRDDNGKVMRAAKNIKRIYDAWHADKGTQMVFSDMSTPSKQAGKDAKKLIADSLKKIYGDSQGRTAAKRIANLSFEEQWRRVMDAAENVLEAESTSDTDREKIEKYFNELEDAEATILTADTGFSVYDDLREVLSGMGIPESEVAFIHDYNTPDQKQKLFARMNSGQIRVLIGSSAKMGAGTNAQRKLVALHHIDAPWRPSDVEQREGRIIRQGNELYMRDPDGFEVEIIAYSTNGTSDTVMWQILERKSGAIEQFRNGGIDSADEEGADSDQYAEFMASSTGNPVFKLKLEAEKRATELQSEIGGLQIAKTNAINFLNYFEDTKAEFNSILDGYSSVEIADAKHGKDSGSVAELSAALDKARADYEKVYAKYLDRKHEIELMYEKAEAAGESTKDLPNIPAKPPRPSLVRDDVQKQSGYARAVGAFFKSAIDMDKGDSTTMTVGNLTLQMDKRDTGFSGDTPRYTLSMVAGGQMFRLYSGEMKDPSKAPNMVNALMPDALKNEVEQVKSRTEKDLARIEERLPVERERAERDIDTSAVDEANKLAEWYKMQVSLAEVAADRERAGKPNKYISQDTRRPIGEFKDDTDGTKRDFIFDGDEFKGTGLSFRGGIDGDFYEAVDGTGRNVIVQAKKVKDDVTEEDSYEAQQVFYEPDQARAELAADPVRSIADEEAIDPEILRSVWEEASKAPLPTDAEREAMLDEIRKLQADDGQFRLDSASVVSGTGNEKGISVEKAQALADEFVASYRGNIPLQIRVGKTQEDLYGPQATRENVGTIKGAYHAASGVFTLAADNLSSVQDARETLRHEIIGHYGLNTFLPEDKRAILDTIIASRDTGSLREIWSNIDERYKDKSESERAEEVFATIAEQEPSGLRDLFDTLYSLIRKALKAVHLADKGVITRGELRRLSMAISKGIRSGKRQQQTFPKSDQDQYRVESDGNESRLSKALKDGAPVDQVFKAAFGWTTKLTKPVYGMMADALTKWDTGGRLQSMDSLIKTARAGLIDRYGLDAEYKKRDLQREADQNNIMQQGVDFLKALADTDMTAGEARVLQAVLTGEKVESHEWDRVAEPIRLAIDDLGREAVVLGLLDEATYKKNRGAYLHRTYLKHEANQSGAMGFFSRGMNTFRKNINGNSLKGRGMDLKVDADKLRTFDKDWWGQTRDPAKFDEQLQGRKYVVLTRVVGRDLNTPTLAGVESGTREGRKRETIYWPKDKPMPDKYLEWDNRGVFEVVGRKAGKVVLWRDFTKDERMKMGEILDARYNIAKTFHLMAHDLANGRFLKDIAENDAWTWRGEGDPDGIIATAKEGGYATYGQYDWVLVPETVIPKTNKKRWGELAGKYVRAEIWRDLNQQDQMMRSTVWRKAMTQWKLNKTARNPVVHMNNVMSNLVFMDMADVRSRDLVAALQAIRSNSQEYQDARNNGAFGGGFVESEISADILEPLLRELSKQAASDKGTFESMLGTAGKFVDGIAGIIKTVDNKMVNAYQLEDTIYRMATYLNRIHAGDSLEDAAHFAREQFLNYDIRAPWVNALRNTVLPFISYTYRAVPVIARSIAERPWKLAKYTTIAWAANALGYMMATGDEDEERAAMPDTEAGYTWLGVPRMIRMPFRDEHGNPAFLDVRRWIPAGDVFDINQGQSAVPIPAPIQFGGPLMLAFEFALNKQAFTGAEITNEYDLPSERLEKVGGWAYRSWMPSAPWIYESWYWDKLTRSVGGATDYYGRPYDLSYSMLSSLGIKVKQHDVNVGRARKLFELEQEARALKAQRAHAERMHRRNMISDRNYEKEVERTEIKMKRIREKAMELR